MQPNQGRAFAIAVVGWWLCVGVLWSASEYALPSWLWVLLLAIPWLLGARASLLAAPKTGEVPLDLAKVALQGGLTGKSFDDGEAVIRQGEPAEHFYIITHGRARVLIDDPDTGVPIEAGELVEGQFFGELGLLTGAPRTASVVATGPLEVLAMNRGAFTSLVSEASEASDAIRQAAAERAVR